ncbi:MAG: hypothetical protein ACYTGZ_03165 [Planctomycetota bacterium]
MPFAKEFFDLQVLFAEKVRDLSGLPLERALFEYTNLYVRFGLGRHFDSDHEGWQAYLGGLRDGADVREWTYRFYLRDPEATTAPPVTATFGSFAYALTEANHVRLHFRDSETDGHSPLAVARSARRRAELTALFRHLKRNVCEDIPVVGVSWLYNLDAYRRLFPPAYASSARVVVGKFRSMPLWGQFLDRRGEVKDSVKHPFLTSLAQQSSLARVHECFPLQVLTTRAPASEFYDFYGV